MNDNQPKAQPRAENLPERSAAVEATALAVPEAAGLAVPVDSMPVHEDTQYDISAATAEEREGNALLGNLLRAFVLLATQNEAKLTEIADLNAASVARAKLSESGELQLLANGVERAVAAMLHGVRGLRQQLIWQKQPAESEFLLGVRAAREAQGKFDELNALDDDSTNDVLILMPYFLKFLRHFLELAAAAPEMEPAFLLSFGRDAAAQLQEQAAAHRKLIDEFLGSGIESDTLFQLVGMLRIQADLAASRAYTITQQLKTSRVYVPIRGDKVFIIHGHAEDRWRELRDLLERKLNIPRERVVVLRELESQGKLLMQKFEDSAFESCFAFSLLTTDDIVRKDGEEYSQARPNALFETGWFYGRFGPSRLCILTKKGTKLPSDLSGVLTLEFSNSVEEVLVRVQDELKAAKVLSA